MHVPQRHRASGFWLYSPLLPSLGTKRINSLLAVAGKTGLVPLALGSERDRYLLLRGGRRGTVG